MPRQKQSKPKALKQQREEVEQLIRDGGPSDPKKQDEDPSIKTSRPTTAPLPFEKHKHKKGKKQHRSRNTVKVKIAKKVRSKHTCINKVLQAKELPVNEKFEVKEDTQSPTSNNNDKCFAESKELKSVDLMADVGSETPCDKLTEADTFKDKYDMIKERSLKRATKVRQTIQEKGKEGDSEDIPKKVTESPKKTPVSPVKDSEGLKQKSPVKTEFSPMQYQPKQSDSQRKYSEKEIDRLPSQNSTNYAQKAANKGRQRSVSEGMLHVHVPPPPQEALSKQQALEALLQITGVEFHTMSKTASSKQPTPSQKMTAVTNLASFAPCTGTGTLIAGLNLNSSTAGKISEGDKDFMNYHLPSNSLEEQGLKLVYTTHAMGNTSQDQINYSSFRSRTNSTMSNASDSTDDPTAKDSQKCCKKLGRHVCQYCGRRCTKPSVLKKHIRSHTGERPYPCAPCGFSFKTKSNLYKHCKTNAHAIKAGPTPNSDDLSKLTSADLEEDDSEETESEDEITCDTTVCLTERCLHQDSDGPLPYSELEDKLAKQAYISPMQVPGSLDAVPVIPRQLVDSQSNKEIISRHSSNGVYSQSPVLSTEMPIPRTCILLPNRSSISSEILSSSRPSSAPSAPLVEFPKSTSTQQAGHLKTDASKDEEVVLSASGASSNQLLKSILPGELAGFRIDMETRRAIPVLNPQLGTSGAPSTTQSGEGASSQHGQLLIPFTGFNIVKSGGQYHVQIPVQGIPEDSLTMSLDSEAGCSADDSGSSSSHAKGISKESLQERIQLLISQNRAIVDNTVLEAVKPRRTSASRRDSENNSPRVESSSDHINDGKIMERQWANPSSFSDFGNLASKHRKDSLLEAKPTPPSRSPMAAYPWPSEGNLLERVLKSQQQNPLLGIASTEKHIINPLIDPKTAKLHLSTMQTGPSSDNSNSIKDLLLQDRPHRLAQIAQHSPVHVYADSPGGRGSPGMRFFPGVSWPYFPMGDSAVSQLRGALQQRPGLELHGPVYAASLNTVEDVNVSQRISELRGTGRRRKYKSESDAFDVMPSGPSSPKRKARKIKDIPTALSPLAANIQHQETNMTSSRPTETQRGTDSASIPNAFASYPGQVPSQQTSFRSPTAHHMTYMYQNALTSESVSLPRQPNMSSPGQTHSSQNIKSFQRHLSPLPSHVTPVQHSLSPLTSMPHQLTMAQGHLAHYPRPVMSGQGHIPTQSGNLPSNSVFQSGYPPRGTSTEMFAQSTRSSTRSSGVHSQTLPALSEVSVIQHTRTQSKDEITNKELKLEVSPARVDESRASVWPYQHPFPVPIQHASPSSQGPHLLAVASRSSDLSSDVSNRKPSFSTAEEMQAAKKHDQQLKPLCPGDVTTNKQQKSDHEAVNTTPIAMQLLAAVANSSSYSPKLSPRRPKDDHITGETDVGSNWSLPIVPKRSNGPVTRIDIPGRHMYASSRESHKQDVRAIPDKELKDGGSPELKKVKIEGSSVHGNPKSPRSDSRAPVSNSSGQSLSSLPKVPASRRHLTLDLKSPLTSRVKSPGASESPKPALQIDPKSLLTPEALSIAESVMKLASPMKTNTPITPVESARELGRLMAHAFHNAGGKVESLITSTQGTMMIGPIATPTPGSGSGSTQYFIIPSPSTSQPPSGFPGPNTLFSPTASTPSSSLISPLRSPLASPAATPVTTSQVQSTQQCVTTDQSPRFKRVPPQKPDCLGAFEKHILRHVKTNSPLKQRIIYSKLSRSMARNSEITQTTSCCVKRPQPMYVEQGNNRKISMYSNWRPGGTCPNPLGISWKSHIALYDSGRNKRPKFYYVNTSISPPQGGIYSDSAVSQTASDKTPTEAQHQSDVSTCTSESSVPGSTLENSLLETRTLKPKERRLKDASEQSEPNRIQIFSGGFKSNEDYVYVRGRGRGKYVCEECGIRCKKPSMLKKHIRTHTDMRPYQCQICNFAFKTKGNLTKHVKSKAHSKKCIKSGISVDDQSCMEHQFSDADDEDTDSADGDTTDEDDEDEDDDISETHSESAVPVAGAVPHRERYSSVPNIQDMPDSFDGQGRPLVWHQYHPGHVKKEQSGLQDGPSRDSTGSITTSNSSKAEASLHDDYEDKQPVKLSRLEVVGKLSRHLTNRHQQSLEKAQKASALTKTAEDKVEDSSRLFEISQLPLFHSSLLPQPINPALLPLATESKNIAQPPAPPILDKYGHIVLTMSRASSSQYRLSTTVQNSLSSRSKVGATNPSMTVIPSPSASMQAPSSSGIELWTYQPGTVTPTAGTLPSQSKTEKTGTASNLTTSGTLPLKDHVPSFVRAQSYTTASVRQPNSHATSVAFQPQQESVRIPTVTVPPGASNLVVGVYPMHPLSNRQIQEMFPPYPVAREAKTMGIAKSGIHQTNTEEFPQQQRNVFFPSSQDPLKSPALSTPDPDKQVLTHSLTFHTKAQLSPRGHSSRFAPYSTSTSTKGIPPPIFLEVISDDEDEHSPRKQQKLDPLHHNIRVSGSIKSSANSSTPSWMSEPGSAIKQLLLARQPLVPPSQDVSKPSFFSPFLPPSLASPISTKSSPNFTLSSPFQPLVSPMMPSKMLQLPPTILSQVRSPTVQSSNFTLKEELRKSPEPFVPPVARGKSQFQMTPPQSHFVDRQGCEDQPPVEVVEELVASPTQIGNHRCPNCSKVFMKPSQLRIHMRIHLEEDSFLCPECSLSYPTRLLLAKHERSEEHLSKVDAVELPSASSESDPRPFKCKECQIAFRIPGHLAKHLRSRGHRMTLEREGKLLLPKEPISPGISQGDLVIDDSHQPSSPAGSSDKTDSASEGEDASHMEVISKA